jgi:hypothetical protein
MRQAFLSSGPSGAGPGSGAVEAERISPGFRPLPTSVPVKLESLLL